MPRIPLIRSGIPRLNGRSVQLPPKQVSTHYQTPKHQDWSAKVRARAGWACERCGARGVRLFADHITEIGDGGEVYSMMNGQCLCGSCHTSKTMVERAKRAFASVPHNKV